MEILAGGNKDSILTTLCNLDYDTRRWLLHTSLDGNISMPAKRWRQDCESKRSKDFYYLVVFLHLSSCHIILCDLRYLDGCSIPRYPLSIQIYKHHWSVKAILRYTNRDSCVVLHDRNKTIVTDIWRCGSWFRLVWCFRLRSEIALSACRVTGVGVSRCWGSVYGDCWNESCVSWAAQSGGDSDIFNRYAGW